jgi:hypothetical protein
MSMRFPMLKSIAVAAALMGFVSMRVEAGPHSTRAESFPAGNAYLQDESAAMPHESPPVDQSVAPADSYPDASAFGGEAARFRVMDKASQVASTGMPAGSPPVDKSAVSADPAPRGVAEEQFLQQNSTH